MADDVKINWEFEFRVRTPDGKVLTHKSFSAFEHMAPVWFGGHVNQVVDQVFEALTKEGYISDAPFS
ncbi:hypothetical protein SEA_KERBEROS_44 [Mycobacterium phage Kerberos]|nr:hypothetical protein SEA_POMAR16_44 [Mycobacterium phage Pomar16]APC43094.1 hypothetical protein SEA_KERBEROS_44 [Mycobacterium phage Kerberos]APC46162.1 hypothetical protein PBI_STARSTUFF_44 [Mycobacterium phage StarStuff]AXH48906.1 hypothetical protein SEA_TOMATHAN_44 [Mycobacterium phage Tomathan]QBP28702.1 hypothetical protein SEA_DBQU4N_44 [Mycobacterium phage DBQu4n]UXE05460.1 hypothetical protein SEA_DUPLO_44 [Mycobacterium phage Duplo]